MTPFYLSRHSAALFERAHRQHPKEVSFASNFGFALLKCDLLDASVEAFDAALGIVGVNEEDTLGGGAGHGGGAGVCGGKPGEAATWAGLAFAEQLRGNLTAAVGHYHKALSQEPGNGFARAMLSFAVTEVAEEMGEEILAG